MDGILLVDKPEGVTSAAVVREVKRTLRCKVGHLGTLDPFASGLLPLVLGDGTKIAQFLNAADKAYEGVIRLGSRTDSGDRTGAVVEELPPPVALTPEGCAAVAAGFRGERMQVPPMYSALKRDGVPLYKLARKGIDVERSARPVTVHGLELEPAGEDRVRIRVHCSKGTYIRVLAEEIGAALGSVGHLESLRRTRFGHFRIEAAVGLPLGHEDATRALIPPRQALADLGEIAVDGAGATAVSRGQVAVLAALPRPRAGEEAAKIVGPGGALLAVVVPDAAGHWQFARVFSASPGPAPEPAAPA
jgi:tRNA pseudouridine55 synthase